MGWASDSHAARVVAGALECVRVPEGKNKPAVLYWETRIPMKKFIVRCLALFTLALSSHAIAAFESAKLNTDNEQPRFPPQLVMDGVTDGQIILAVKISAEG